MTQKKLNYLSPTAKKMKFSTGRGFALSGFTGEQGEWAAPSSLTNTLWED